MALTATIYNLTVELADMDRKVYETLDLRIARHPSESLDYMLTRVLAYSLEFQEGIAMTEGVSASDEPALLVRDLTGRITVWIEIGMPDAARLHRASKRTDRVVVYTHRDVRQLLAQCKGEKIHRAEDLPIYAFDRTFIADASGCLERRTEMSLSVTDRELYLSVGERTFQTPVVEHRLE